MKPLLMVGSALAFLSSFVLMRPVLHGYIDHGHLDVFHLVVAMVAAVGGVLLLYRGLRRLAA